MYKFFMVVAQKCQVVKQLPLDAKTSRIFMLRVGSLYSLCSIAT